MAKAIEVVRIFSISRWVKYNHIIKYSTWPCILFRCLFAFNTQASYGATERVAINSGPGDPRTGDPRTGDPRTRRSGT